MEEKATHFRPVFTASNISPFIGPQPFAGKPTSAVVTFLDKFQPFKGWKEARLAKVLWEHEEVRRAHLESIENNRSCNVEKDENNEVNEKYYHPWGFEFGKTGTSIQDRVDLNKENADVQTLTSGMDSSGSHAMILSPQIQELKEPIPRKARQKLNLNEINKDFSFNFVKTRGYDRFDCGAFDISGIPDGVDDLSKTILKSKLKNKNISETDKIQVLIYMKIHKCNSCLFVEVGQNDQDMPTSIRYEWDEDKFNHVIERLKDFTINAKTLTRKEFFDMI